MTLRLLHVVSTLDRYSAAGEMMAVARRLTADEFASEVCCLGHTGPIGRELEEAGLSCRTLDRRWPIDLIAMGRLIHYLRDRRPNIVHAWDSVAAGYATFASRAAGKPPVVEQRTTTWPYEPRRLSRGWRPWGRDPAVYVAASKSIRAQDLPPNDARVPWKIIPPGVAEPPTSNSSREDLLHELRLPADVKLIGVAGPLVPRFGVKELIWAADMVRVLHPNMRMLIVGDGPERPHLERFAHTAAEPENICFLGERDDLARLLTHLDVYWQGSEPGVAATEVLEAMAAGVPVVASDTPTHREWIRHEESGYLVGIEARADRTRVTDALFNDASLARRVGAAGRDRARSEFAIERRVELFAELYRGL